MAKLESYSNLAKLQEDLLKKGFCFSQVFALGVYAKTPQGVSFKSSFKHSTDKENSAVNSALASFNYKDRGLSIKEEFRTSKIYKTTVEYIPENASQVKGKLEIELDSNTSSQKKAVTLEYTHEKFKGKAVVTDDVLLKLSTVASVDGVKGLGIDLAYDVNESRFSSYNAALWWFAKDYRLVAKHLSTNKKAYTFGNFSASVLYNLSEKSKIATLVTYSSGKELDVCLGLQYNPEESRVFKMKIDQNLLLGFSMRNKVNNMLSVVTASQFNLLDLNAPAVQFGIRLKVNQ